MHDDTRLSETTGATVTPTDRTVNALRTLHRIDEAELIASPDVFVAWVEACRAVERLADALNAGGERR